MNDFGSVDNVVAVAVLVYVVHLSAFIISGVSTGDFVSTFNDFGFAFICLLS